MRFTTIAMSAALTAPLLFSGSARAGQDKGAAKPTLADAELQAVNKLHHANEMEIEMGKLGTERAKAADVKSFAGRMVRDHKKADGKVTALAKKRGATLAPPAPQNDDEKKKMDEAMATMARLRGLEGEAFDREFMAAMVKDHAAALQLVTDSLAQAKDASLVALLKGVKPVIEQHKAAAEKIAGKQAGDGAKPAPSAPKPTKG
ncbi:MAG TPA: DUF4142 domain-containing protein [Kofleriaceae bacterium]|nr:DUF4142 domain-containing protein [Kofleriaceae bacterium]